MRDASGAFSFILLLHHRIPFTVTIQVHYFCSYMKMLKFCWNSQSSYKYSRIYQILFYMRNMLSNLFLSCIRQVLRENTGIWDRKSTYNISLRFLKIIAVRFTKQVFGIRHCIIMEESIQSSLPHENEIDSSKISFANGENTVLSARNPIILTLKFCLCQNSLHLSTLLWEIYATTLLQCFFSFFSES